MIPRFYVLDPTTGLFLNWAGEWTSFIGAKDFLSEDAAREFARSFTLHFFVFLLCSH